MNLIKNREYLVLSTGHYETSLRKIKVLEVTEVAYLVRREEEDYLLEEIISEKEKKRIRHATKWELKAAFIPNSENLTISNHNGQTVINPIPHKTTITPSRMYVVMEDLSKVSSEDTSWVTGTQEEGEAPQTINESFTPVDTMEAKLTKDEAIR